MLRLLASRGRAGSGLSRARAEAQLGVRRLREEVAPAVDDGFEGAFVLRDEGVVAVAVHLRGVARFESLGRALLEVLDPEQNDTFADHYPDVDYDLSNIMFITTANSVSTIPLPLLDRMELIQIAGYTELEKLQICKKYLVPKSCEKNGLKPENVEITDDALLSIIRH